MKRTITLDWLKSKDACVDGVQWFKDRYTNEVSLKKLIADLQETGQYEYLSWLLTNLFDKRKNVKYAIYAAELVLPIWQKVFPDEKSPEEAIKAAKAWLKNPTEENMDAAWDAAWAAADDAADDAADAARAAAWAAWAAADDAADDAADAADAADDARAAASAAWAARAAQKGDTYKKITDYGIELLAEEK